MQQQQQPASYDLLAVFNEENQAETAAEKLRKEGFTDEVYQLPAGFVGSGQFREHGPDKQRSEQFLEVKRARPSAALIGVLILIFALVIGGLSFLASLALPHILPEPATIILGIALGIILGSLTGAFGPGRRVRGNIGQDLTKKAPTSTKAVAGALTVVALRFSDPENIRRTSRARAILINNQGKIDRSVSRRE